MGSSDVEWGGVLERAGERLAWNLVLEVTRAASPDLSLLPAG